MKPNQIKAGMRCTVGWFDTGHLSIRRNYVAYGRIVFRRGGRIKFRWQCGDSMDADFVATPRHSCENFWVDVRDLNSIDGTPISEWAKLRTNATPQASLRNKSQP